MLRTTRPGAARDLSAAVAESVERVIAVGGDGTLNEVVGGLLDSGLATPRLPELGFLPAGTGNAAVRAFGLEAVPEAMAAALPRAESTPVDVGLVRHERGERAFLLWFGAGLDAVVVHALASRRSGPMGMSGLLASTPLILKELMRYGRPPIFAEVDGDPLGVHASTIVANVGEIPFSGSVAESADPSDGRLDVVGVPHSSTPGSVGLGLRMMTMSLTRSRSVSHRQGTRISLRADGHVPFQVDGEAGGALPATVTLRPQALRLLRTPPR